MTNIYLARHGETDFNKNKQIQGRGIDEPLNGRGRRQALAIADYVKEMNLRHIYSSSLKRSRETADIIAQKMSLDVRSHEDLDEMNFGSLEGRPIIEIESELQILHSTWKSGATDHACENGESPKMVLARADNRINSILQEHQQSNIMFVLHGRLIRILMSHWMQYGLSDMHRIPHNNGALYHLQWDGQVFEALYINKTDHLNGDVMNNWK